MEEKVIGLTDEEAVAIFLGIMGDFQKKYSVLESKDIKDIKESINVLSDTMVAMSGLKNMIIEPKMVSDSVKLVAQALVEQNKKDGK